MGVVRRGGGGAVAVGAMSDAVAGVVVAVRREL